MLMLLMTVSSMFYESYLRPLFLHPAALPYWKHIVMYMLRRGL